MRTPKILTVAAIGILLAATPSFAGQRGRGGSGSPPRGSGGSPPAGRAVPRGPTNPGSAYARPGYPARGGPYGYGRSYYRYPYYGYGRSYYGYPYYYGYPGFSFSLGFG